MQVKGGWKKPLAEGRMLLLSYFGDGVRQPTETLAVERNEHIAAFADGIFVAHASVGGKTERLCKSALARGKPVFTLDSGDNAHLVGLGARPVRDAADLCGGG